MWGGGCFFSIYKVLFLVSWCPAQPTSTECGSFMEQCLCCPTGCSLFDQTISIKGVHMIFFYVCVFSQWPHPHVSVFIWIAAADFLKTINILMSPVWENTQTECLFKKQKRCAVVRLHILGAGVASSIPMQYPVRVLARPFMLQTKRPWNGSATSAACPQHGHKNISLHVVLCVILYVTDNKAGLLLY